MDIIDYISIKIHRAKLYYKNRGMVQFIVEIFRQLGFELFNYRIIFAILDLNDLPDQGDKENSCTFHTATIDELRNEENYLNERYPLKETIYRIKQGHLLFVQLVDGRMVNFLWVVRKNACLDWFCMPLNVPPNMVYEYGGYTIPEFRGRGFASRNKKSAFHHLKREGVRYVLAALVPNNLVARHIHKKMGFVEYETVHYRRFWHIRYYTVEKTDATDRKSYISLFKTPKNLWSTFALLD